MGAENSKDKKNIIVDLCEEGITRALSLGIVEKIHPGVYVLTMKGHKLVDKIMWGEEIGCHN